MKIKENYNLKSLNTFGINVDAKYFAEVASIDEIKEAGSFIDENNLQYLILGGGSNILFKKDFKGIAIKINLKGIEILKEDKEHIYIKVYAGENWDEFVQYCVEHKYAGLENLSLIPGSVGASPIQNIGAYGVELKDHFHELEFYNFSDNSIQTIQKEDCRFGYRSSIFKKELKGQGIILSVTFRLDKTPVFKTDYGVLNAELEKTGMGEISLKAIRLAICNIRQNKLPDPEFIGNAGSFYKNPVVSENKHKELKAIYKNLVSFSQADGSFKLAAGWLIDQCGWKGKRSGDAGVHENQALVMVNYGKATGQDILNLSDKIKNSVLQKFGVELEMEVNVV